MSSNLSTRIIAQKESRELQSQEHRPDQRMLNRDRQRRRHNEINDDQRLITRTIDRQRHRQRRSQLTNEHRERKTKN